MEVKRFIKNDDSFICAHCGKEVLPLGYTSRNHCPFCLWSLHVDVNPGDRANPCGGPLEPVSAVPDPKRGIDSDPQRDFVQTSTGSTRLFYQVEDAFGRSVFSSR
jgi:hypothetical protein